MTGGRGKVGAGLDAKQKTMLSFLTREKSSSQKENDETDAVRKKAKDVVVPSSPPSKRAKTDWEGDSDGCAQAPASNITPEQRKMILDKALGAKIIKECNSLQVLDRKMGPTWFQALEGEFRKDYFRQLNDFVISQRNRTTVYPPPDGIFEWTKQCDIKDIKVVILGQDPYHGPKQAHGLCFSVQKGVPPPPSLVNMYKELQTDIEGFKIPNHGYLVGWAQQGVLLLNAVLTVEAGKANSHKDKGWEKLTDAVISWISKNLNSVVFLLWGSYAQKKAAVVDKKRHHLLQAVHPSPLSAHRGFFGCKHFSKCNELLVKNGKKPIDWSHLP